MEELVLIMCSLVIAGFGAGWIVKDCVIVLTLSFMNRVPHQPEVSEAEEEAEDVEEEAEEVTEGTDEEARGSEEATLLNLNNQVTLYVKYLYLKEKLEKTMGGKNS